MTQVKTDSTRVTLKVSEAARIAGCGQRAIRNGIDEGSIPHLRFGRNIVIPRSAFLRWLDTPQVTRKHRKPSAVEAEG